MQKAVLLIGLSALSAVCAAEEPINLRTNSKSQYFLLVKGGTVAKPTMVVKRLSSGGTSFTKRAFDCEARTAMHLGSGETLAAMEKAKPDPGMEPLTPNSITHQLWQMACGKQ